MTLRNKAREGKPDELISKYLAGEASEQEWLQIDNWVRSSYENKNYFNDFKLIWEQSKKLKYQPSFDEDIAWKKFKQRVESASDHSNPARSKYLHLTWLRAAALLTAVMLTGWASYILFNKFKKLSANAGNNYTIRTEMLSDGTVVTLNTNSALVYPASFHGNQRKVHLQGDCFFTVAPDQNRPFIVEVNDLMVRVVGTAFEIHSTDFETEVTVKSGIVNVTRQKATVLLNPGDKVIVSKSDTTLVPEKIKAFKLMMDSFKKKLLIDSTKPEEFKLTKKMMQFYKNKSALDTTGLGRRVPVDSLYQLHMRQVKTDRESLEVSQDEQGLLNAVRKAGGDTIILGTKTIDSMVREMIRLGQIDFNPPVDTSSLEMHQYKDIIKEVMRELIKENIVPDAGSIASFKLTDKEFVINGKKLHEEIFQEFSTKYIHKSDYGIFYGAEKMVTADGFHLEKINL
jgi:transmembrane sensor